MPSGRVEAVIAHYETAALTRMAVWSLHGLHPDLPITVVDNGSSQADVQALRTSVADVHLCRIVRSETNLHHGPALDLAIRQSEAEWVLVFDSDCIAYRKGLVPAMLQVAEQRSAYLLGEVCFVDDGGYATTDVKAHRYVHPKCALVRRATYLELPPFEKHGAPCLANERAAAERGHLLADFPVGDYVYHLGRGTVAAHGYGLGLKGKLHQLRHRLGR